MKYSGTISIALLNHLFVLSNAQSSVLDVLIGPYLAFRKLCNQFNEDRLKEKYYKDELISTGRIQDIVPVSVPFPCSTMNGRSKERPTNVNSLKPGDIDVIGAIGDSIMTGYGLTATNIGNILHNNRGMVYSIGGQSNWREFTTLPNILKEYNPKLIGYSLGTSLTIDRESQFNVAEDGAVSYNIPYMTKVLIQRIAKDPRINITNDWKMITISIGANDFCSEICYFSNPEDSVKRHKEDLLSSLRLLRDHLPRTFVNLVLPPDVSVLTTIDPLPIICYFAQRVVCPCFAGERFRRQKEYLLNVISKFQEIELEVINYEEFDKNDFTVVAHFFLSGIVEAPKISNGDSDQSFLAADCFHFSQKSHSLLARALWNSLWIPVGEKPSTYNTSTFINSPLTCPTVDVKYICTRQNSILY